MPSNYIYKNSSSGNSNSNSSSSSSAVRRSTRRRSHKPSRQPPSLPLEIWFQILTQTLNLLLPISTTPRTYSTYILPLLLTSHTFHEHCHSVTYPHLRKHRLLQLFTRWKAAHSREVHFYHHPLSVRVRYALPDRVGNPPGEEYETLYSFIKRAYLFGCESVCGTVIPVEGGLEGVAAAAAAAQADAGQAQNAAGNGGAAAAAEGAAAAPPGTANAAAATTSAPASAATGATTPGNVVVAPPVAPTAAPVVIQQGGDGGGQGWKGHALQWHVANPTFAAEGTIELYREVVEEYRRVVCGSAASRERSRQLEQTMDRIKNPHRYPDLLSSACSSPSESTFSQDAMTLSRRNSMTSEDTALEGDTEDMDEDDSEEEEEEDEEEEEEDSDCCDEENVAEDDEEELSEKPGDEMIEQDQDLLLNEIEAKGGLRRRDSGHGQSSSEMDIDEDADDELDHEDMVLDSDMEPKRTNSSRASSSKSSRVGSSIDNNGEDEQVQQQPRQQGRTKRTTGKREPDTMAMDYELEGTTPSRQRRGGLRSQTQQHQQKMERSRSASEQERIIMDMSLDKPYPTLNCNPLSPFYIERPTSAGSCSSSSKTRSGSPGPLTPLGPISLMVKAKLLRAKSSQRLALHRSLSSPASSHPATKSATSPLSSSSSSSSGSTGSEQPETTRSSPSTCATTLENNNNSSSNTVAAVSPSSPSSLTSSSSSSSGPLKAEDIGFDLASACANTFASDLAFVLARVPGLGAHFHRFEQLAKLKLHVGWAKHAQSRGGNDVFVMSCSRLIAILAPLANTPLVSERGGGLAP